MHELPQLGKLEAAYPQQLTVIGVHSPKYPAEAQPEAVRQAVQRLGIHHPVVGDPDFAVWDAYAVKAWPTLVFLSPTGQVVGSHAGETSYEALQRVIAEMVSSYGREGTLAPGAGPAGIAFERPKFELCYPGKVLARDDGMMIADSGHHRVLLVDSDGVVRGTVGGTEAGFADGNFGSARFDNPQGLAYDAEPGILYVADAGNHAIRAIDLDRATVITVAGTGLQARRVVRSGPARSVALSSPWDLTLHRSVLYIAMAGTHQVWSLDLETYTIAVWAGTGHEALRDGPREACWMAQPMGIARSDNDLLVSCAEAQAVRRIDLRNDTVSTLVGTGLFDFGDRDGARDRALLQHCQAVDASQDGSVYVADTYNHRIKTVERGSNQIAVLCGSGIRGLLDGPGPGARFNEPGGLSLHADQIYVADTNNHAIRVVDAVNGHVRTARLLHL